MCSELKRRVSFPQQLNRVLLAFAFALPISIAIAEPLAYVALVLALLVTVRREPAWRIAPHGLYWPMATFFAVVLASVFFSVRPSVSVSKVPRLLLMALVPIIAASCGVSREQGRSLFRFFAAGCVLRALYQIGLLLWTVRQGGNVFDVGNMRDPQMYLAASVVLLAQMRFRRNSRFAAFELVALVFTVLGWTLNFKRGVWIAFGVAMLFMIVASRSWRWLLLLISLLGLFGVMPWTRQRIQQMGQEFSTRSGGRYVLWTEVAPQMLRQYPQGMGYAATRNEDFLKYAPSVQPKLNHLHNNALQITLELGMVGFLAWLWWVGYGLVVGIRSFLIARRCESNLAGLSLGSVAALIGLLVNGMVEYNFGDSEILMLWYFLNGLIVYISQYLVRAGAVERAL